MLQEDNIGEKISDSFSGAGLRSGPAGGLWALSKWGGWATCGPLYSQRERCVQSRDSVETETGGGLWGKNRMDGVA